jgi:phage terminase large subunit
LSLQATLQIELPEKLLPVFAGPARIRGAYGGRGSAKTRSFAKMAAVWGLRAAQEGREGIVVCAREFMNSLEDSSFAEVAAAIASEPWLSENYEVGEKFIRTRCRRVDFSFVGLRYNVNSIKSKAMILLCWVDEAEPVTEAAWIKLEPTVREDGSELWVTWNPELKGSATDKNFRQTKMPDAKIVEMNWRDNPWFPKVLDDLRRRHMLTKAEHYAHIWDGDYATVSEGAYYAADLLLAREEGRIGRVAPDPLVQVRTYHDIGGSGAKSDAYSIWAVQFVGREVRVLNHYSARGQPLAEHVAWMRKHKYTKVILPHDGVNPDHVVGARYVDHWRAAGFDADEPYRGYGGGVAGAPSQRVEAVRRLFPQIWFNEATTQDGRISLGRYHARIDEKTGRDMGPDHDRWSHDADAFGLMAVCYEAPRKHAEKLAMPQLGVV